MIISEDKNPKGQDLGGKATGLQNMVRLGLDVPDFMILRHDLFEVSVDHVDNKPKAASLKAKLEGHVLKQSIKQQILDVLKTWDFPNQALVVRSSVADEDGSQHAFAGMMDSYLNIQSEEDLWKYIALTASSAYNERAIDYRLTHGLDLKTKVSVIIQKQVDANVSGVMFTTFPEYPQETAIHAVWGFGEGIVGGHITPDEYYVLKSTGALHRQHVETQDNSFVKAKKAGLSESVLETDKAKRACLTEQQCFQLFTIAQRLERELKGPMDIEFVWDKSQLWIVQCRPITQVIPEPIVYDNSNIQESYCGVTTPLTFSFARRAYATVYRQTMKALGLNATTITSNEPVITELLGLVQGRIYYNINNWYKGLQLLPKFEQNKSDMERMMGLTDPVDFVEDQRKNWKQKLLLLPEMIVNLTRLLKAFSNLDNHIKSFRVHFKEVFDWYYEQELNTSDFEILKRTKLKLDQQLLEQWDVPIINDFFVMMHNGKVVRLLNSLGIEDTDDFQCRLFAGDHQMENTLPTKEMLKIATEIRQDDTLKQMLIQQEEGVLDIINQDFPELALKVRDYIINYGDRTVGELKLETHTMRVDPTIFYQYLRNYLKSETLPTLDGNSHLNEEALIELNERLNGKAPWAKKKAHKKIQKLQQGIRNREALRMERTRLFGMYRDLYLHMGQLMVTKGDLKIKEDVFWLEEDEVWSQKQTPKQALVSQRQMEFDSYRSVEVPSRVIDPYPPVEQVSVDEDDMVGKGCYPGVVTGECVVVTSPEDDLDVTGKIIVALRTDPGWASLFPVCKAVLIEKGSSLSHSVILLRELGIPTIININGLTKKIQSGQNIHINAKSGEVKIIEE
ncbi:MAG: PEP-utilizing enzyme [Reichenbachiella sp.]